MLFYNEDYITFIKTYLVHSCYIEYTKMVCDLKTQTINSSQQIATNNYNSDLLYYAKDVSVWNNVFENVSPVLTYYLHLLTNFKGLTENEQRMPNYIASQLADVYSMDSFQEYLDKKININTIGAADYQQFIKNMQSPEFKDKMVQKYTTESIRKTVKNHLIYVVRMYVMKQLGTLVYTSYQEDQDVDVMLNAVPYFAFLRDMGYTVDDINDDKIPDRLNTTVDELAFHRLELQVMRTINNMF